MNDIDETEIRDRILLATLPHVAFDGWVDRTLEQGVRDAGYPADMAFRAFPGGVADVIRHWSAYGDRRMREAMAGLDLSAMALRARLVAAIRRRIAVDAAHREAVRRTLAHLALPGNAGIAAGNLARTLDAVWHAAGDRSADFSYYTKRAMLLPIYVATVLYWLDDESEGSAETWGFLARRIDDVMTVPKLQARLRARLDGLAAPFRRLQRGGAAYRRRHA